MIFPIGAKAMAAGSSRRTFLKALGGMSVAAAQDAASASPGGENFRQLKKAMWVWKTAPDHLDALKAFAGEVGVDTLLWSMPPEVRAGIAAGDVQVISSVRALREGVRSLFALTGDPSWVQSPQRMPRSLAQIIEAAAGGGAMLDGVSLDIEPNALPAWHDPERRQGLLKDTVAFYEMVRSRARHVRLDAALNPAFAETRLQDNQTFLGALIQRLDSVSLMAYRDNPERTIKWAAPAIEVIENMDVPWRLGVLVHASSEAGTSFAGRDRAAFETDMVALDGMVRRQGPSAYYRGLIFEDYGGLTRILRA